MAAILLSVRVFRSLDTTDSKAATPIISDLFSLLEPLGNRFLMNFYRQQVECSPSILEKRNTSQKVEQNNPGSSFNLSLPLIIRFKTV